MKNVGTLIVSSFVKIKLHLTICLLGFIFSVCSEGKRSGQIPYTGIQSSHEYYNLHLEEMLGLQLSVP